jgi:poly-gamma-glutamate capsule biosynthesis protein CapA/YwtB (metallophosphatase superfamily)
MVDLEPSAAAPAASAAAPEPVILRVSAVGDCTLGGDYRGDGPNPFDAAIAAHGGDLRYPFSGVLSTLADDDVTVANLEGPLTSSDKPVSQGTYRFRGKPEYARILAEGSVEIVNLANNHSDDFGDRGFKDTVHALTQAGVGAAADELVDVRTVKGVEVVNLGFTGGDAVVLDRVERLVRAKKRENNLVIVSFHWGNEGIHEILDIQRMLGRTAVDAGADLVLGTHPHVIQGIERYRGKQIVYSLGNFVFGGNVNPADKDAIIFRATFRAEGGHIAPSGSEVLPVRVCTNPLRNDFRPVLLEGEDRTRVLGLVDEYSAGLDGAKIRSKAFRRP